jgi:hypothetical protein
MIQLGLLEKSGKSLIYRQMMFPFKASKASIWGFPGQASIKDAMERYRAAGKARRGYRWEHSL